MKKLALTLTLSLFAIASLFAQDKKPNGIGTLYPTEWFTYTDNISGVNIKVLTDTLSNDSYIYQTDPMWTADGRFILFRSSVRAGEKRKGQFFLMEASTGRMLQITEGDHGSVYLANKTNHFFINRKVDNKKKGSTWNLYKVSIDELWNDATNGRVKKAGRYEHLLASIPLNDSIIGNPGGWCVSCNDDFAYIVVERKGTSAELEEMERIAFKPEGNQPIKIKPSLGGIRKVNLNSGEVSVVVNTLFKVGHIQSSRFINEEILFCNETGGDAHQRMWFVRADGTDFRPIYKETPLDWVTHETFQTKDHVYFNILGFQDRLRKQASGIMRINLRTNDVECLGQVELEGCPFNPEPMLGGRGFWHCNSTRDGKFSTGDTFAGNVYIINNETGQRTLIATDCKMKPDHAQPHFSPDGKYLLFQSGHFTDGKRLNLMMVDVQSALHTDKHQVSVKDFGAKGDGKTIDSESINQTIKSVSQSGGGTVLFPKGQYMCYSIRLQNNVTLHLEEGAEICAANHTETTGYDTAEDNPFDKYQDFGHSHWCNSLIYGIGLHNIAIEGKGRITGSNMTRGLSRNKSFEANKAIALRECTGVRLEGFEMLQCGHFALLATGVKDMTIKGLRIDTNRDALDIDCCQDVTITDCQVNSPWDDAIVLKSSYALGRFLDCERILVERCKVTGYDCGTFLDGTLQLEGPDAPDRGGRTGRIKLGTESSGGYRDITIRNCQFEWCRGIALETVDGGKLENITIENIDMNHITNAAIFLRLGSRMRSPEGTPVGCLNNVVIRNIKAHDVDSRYSSIISGIPNHHISNVLLENIEIEYRGGIQSTDQPTNPLDRHPAPFVNLSQSVPEAESVYPEPWMFGIVPAKGFYIRHAKNITFRNVHLSWQQPDIRETFIHDDCENIKME